MEQMSRKTRMKAKKSSVATPADCRQLHDREISSVEEYRWGCPAVGGAYLRLYECEELKQEDKALVSAELRGSGESQAWQKGVLFASGQNLASFLMETPAYEMIRTIFAEIMEKNLKVLRVKLRSRSHLSLGLKTQKLDLFKVWPNDGMNIWSSCRFTTGAASVQVKCRS